MSAASLGCQAWDTITDRERGHRSAQNVSAAQLIEMAKKHAPGLEQALRDTLTDATIQKGGAAAEFGEFLFAVTADKQPTLLISAPSTGDAPPVAATKVGGLWVDQQALISRRRCWAPHPQGLERRAGRGDKIACPTLPLNFELRRESADPQLSPSGPA